MSARRISRVLGAALVMTGAALLSAPVPVAFAQPCPDVEVVFARGTAEPPGVGATGQAFVDALRPQIGARSLNEYGVNYEASSNFDAGIDFARTVVDGIWDARNHVEATATNCPNTRIVLGGYSQGAVVAGFATADGVPEGVPPEYASYMPTPLPASVADNVAAVVLFGKPSDVFMSDVGAPPIKIGSLFASKTIQLCAPGDTICDGAAPGAPNINHVMYPVNGMVNEGATFAAGRL